MHLQCILVIVDFALDTRSLPITKFKRVNKEGEGLDAREAAAIALLLCMVCKPLSLVNITSPINSFFTFSEKIFQTARNKSARVSKQ